MSEKLAKHGQAWTETEIAEMRAMLGEGTRWAVIAEHFGRSLGACQAALRWESITHEQRLRRNLQKNKKLSTFRPERWEDGDLPSWSNEGPDPEALAERDRATSAGWRDLTAWQLGDPLPGRSALDRRTKHA